jgi:hypothetical protein
LQDQNGDPADQQYGGVAQGAAAARFDKQRYESE